MSASGQSAQFTNAQTAREFMLAGNARVTLVSVATGARFTFRIRQPDESSPHWIGVLTGSDNESDYTPLGRIDSRGRYFRNGKSRIGADAPSAKAFDWAWRRLSTGDLGAALAIYHEGRCGRCARALTVPESVESGFGPECSGRRARSMAGARAMAA